VRFFEKNRFATSERHLREVEAYIASIRRRRPAISQVGSLIELFTFVGEDDLLAVRGFSSSGVESGSAAPSA